jgi:hypothetical protein
MTGPHDISGFGMRINIIASQTFPSGFMVTQFADDADPFDLPSIQIADKAMGLNGDLVVWSKAAPIDVTINVIPGGEDDRNLQALTEANRVSKGKHSARDTITMTRIDVDGESLTMTNGRLTDAPVGSSVASAGRKKTSAYTFTFESKASA